MISWNSDISNNYFSKYTYADTYQFQHQNKAWNVVRINNKHTQARSQEFLREGEVSAN